jgi:hypothetical protein
MKHKHSVVVQEITDSVLLSLVSGGSAEHDHSTDSGGSSSDSSHSAQSQWGNYMNTVMGMEGRSCNDGNIGDGATMGGSNISATSGCAGGW